MVRSCVTQEFAKSCNALCSIKACNGSSTAFKKHSVYNHVNACAQCNCVFLTSYLSTYVQAFQRSKLGLTNAGEESMHAPTHSVLW